VFLNEIFVTFSIIFYRAFAETLDILTLLSGRRLANEKTASFIFGALPFYCD